VARASTEAKVYRGEQLGRSHILRLWLVPLRGNEYADVLFLSVPDTSRERRDSTNNCIAKGTIELRNIGEYRLIYLKHC